MADFDSFVEELRTPVELSAIATARIMAAVRADATRRLRRTRILRAFAAAAVVVLAIGSVIAYRMRSERGDQTGTVVQFAVPVPTAHQVVVVGDFNHWDTHATPLRRTASGTWRAAVRLKPGAHVYSFVVDGTRWMPDPTAPQAPGSSDFGSPNSLVTVAPGTT
ncbi:MAG TPA: isoamylase early set domain-containing protein [Gemmatimonadaceae bacterium]|nr:isoamylase early set domain-containing protein [Gemmatimonadaceae bacterium]